MTKNILILIIAVAMSLPACDTLTSHPHHRKEKEMLPSPHSPLPSWVQHLPAPPPFYSSFDDMYQTFRQQACKIVLRHLAA
mmetsp:Transcript_26969/g.88183  ORF Transcript_26969/g.88183 Transcript_26969/m.88183 type:complete len:81 (+) Transcript_26969:122-364(+)